MDVPKNDNRPIHEIRLGRIKAAIWQNESEHGIRHSVSIARLYRNEDRWQSTTSFGRDDMPLVAKVADLAHTWLYQHGNDHRGSSSASGQPAEGTAKPGDVNEPVA